MRRANTQPTVDCPTRKIPFGSRADAGDGLRNIRRNGTPGGQQLTTYKCQHCRRWHIGHSLNDP